MVYVIDTYGREGGMDGWMNKYAQCCPFPAEALQKKKLEKEKRPTGVARWREVQVENYEDESQSGARY